MPDIVLTTFNARYAHAAFGLRYLLANLGPLRERARILEFDIGQRPVDALERILAESPRVVGLGVYIWNVEASTVLAAQLKRLRPEVVLVLGGPEVSHETDQQEIVRYADYVVTGEGDLAFAELCGTLLNGERPAGKVIAGGAPRLESGPAGGEEDKETEGQGDNQRRSESAIADPQSVMGRGLRLPYDLYTDEDIRNRVVYVEASRGCPFRCEFCLSSLDVPVRNVPLEVFLPAMQGLLNRGLNRFKFVDRTFNLNLKISSAILEFFLARWREGMFLHFEMIPDRLPEALRGLIEKFPPGGLQFEVGIQTFNEEVAARISRRQDNAKVEENLRFLRERTGVHVHADLIAGLPGEDLESFASGFDRLVGLGPQEIQVGILKRLRGAPIARHDRQWGMIYSPCPPYEVMATGAIDFATMQRVRRLARYWDLVGNSGNFRDTLPMLWRDPRAGRAAGEGEGGSGGSPFWRFKEFSDRLHERMGRSHGIALQDLAEFLFGHLVGHGWDRAEVGRRMWEDYQRGGRSDRPAFLREYIDGAAVRAAPRAKVPRRQGRHLL